MKAFRAGCSACIVLCLLLALGACAHQPGSTPGSAASGSASQERAGAVTTIPSPVAHLLPTTVPSADPQSPTATTTSDLGTYATADAAARARESRLTPALPRSLEAVPTVEANAITGEVPEELLRAMLDDLQERLGPEGASIAIERAEEVIWSDGSLGCPQPGAVYTQAEVSGYWLVFKAGGGEFDYRAAESGYFFLCESPLFVPAVPAGASEAQPTW